MRMRTRKLAVEVDCVFELTQIGELAKLGHLLGFEVVIDRGDEDDDEAGAVVTFLTDQRARGQGRLVDLAIILAVARGWSGTQLLDELRRDLVRRCFPMDRPLEDSFELGAPPEDHTH